MSDIREQLVLSKKKLTNVLGDNEKLYWLNMKSWFKQRISKEEFDCEARKLLPKHETHLHNEFLLAVLTKCHIPSISGIKESTSTQPSNKIKKSKRLQAIKRKYDHRFAANKVSVSPPTAAQHEIESKSAKAASSAVPQPLKLCVKSFLMPSVDEMKNYVSVIAWEMGLDDAKDDAIALATDAVRVFLKNLLSAIFSRRSAYKTLNQSFKYSMGCEPENPYLKRKRSTFSSRVDANHRMRMSSDVKEQNEIEGVGRVAQVAFGNKTPVNMYDLHLTLKVFGPTLIPSHTIYSLVSERVSANLWHPDLDEIKHDRILSDIMQPPA